MAGKIVDKFLEKVPFSNEIIDAVNKNFDLTFTKQLAAEISHQLLEQGSKLKNEITNAVSEQIRKEIRDQIDKTDKAKLLAETLENLEITITFKPKKRSGKK
ncbi:hypothetical protein J6253_02525 [bacterium]|jgi:hypothetical protein|nr:hypothetical protein [bacterium]MBP5591328.1 hypothetical protein [bacterium]